MKLNLVADYELPNKKRFVRTFAIDQSLNLANLREMTVQSFKRTNGEQAFLPPQSLTMCESGRKARDIADTWEREYKEQGRLWDYSLVECGEVAA